MEILNFVHLSGTQQTVSSSLWQNYFVVRNVYRSSDDCEGRTLAPLVQRGVMIAERPNTFLEPEQFRRIAQEKFAKAVAAPTAAKREQILATAYAYLSLAEIKGWTSSPNLQPPQ
jgi:hypothetical protein